MGLKNDAVMAGQFDQDAGKVLVIRRLNTVPMRRPVAWVDMYCGGYSSLGKTLKAGVKETPLVASAIDALNLEKKLLQSEGVPDLMIDRIITQDYMESGAFTNTGYKKYNNPGGIMWPAKGLKYGKKGGWNAKNKSYWASFPNMKDYVKQKILVLQQGPGYPMSATTGPDFVHRLKMNNYFGKESEAKYLAALRGAAQRINLISAMVEDAHQDIAEPDGDKGLWPWVKAHPIATGAGITLVGLVVLKAVLRR